VLALAGARVTRVNVYRTLPAPPVSPRRDLEQEGIDDVLLASPSAVTGLLNQARVGTTTRCFTIGPTTSAAAISAGLVVTGESATPDLDGLMEAMQCTTGA
jgi:uroporphyrinogen-III synthase